MRTRAVFIAAVLVMGVITPAGADTVAPGVPVGSFTITGSVSRPVTMTVAQLQG
jgi:hypothetical protein